MRCLYCGKELALLKRWTGGGEFCSDAHRQQYQEEYNQLALNRLLQAKPRESKPQVDAKASEKPVESKPAPPPEAFRPVSRAPEPEPKPVLKPVAEEPAPAQAGFFLELPVPVAAGAVEFVATEIGFERQFSPRLPESAPCWDTVQLPGEPAAAGRIALFRSIAAVDSPIRAREGKLELREFLRPAPVVEFDLPADGVKGIAEKCEDPMDIIIFPQPPPSEPPLWREDERNFSLQPELGALARLMFRTTGIEDDDSGELIPPEAEPRAEKAPPPEPARPPEAAVAALEAANGQRRFETSQPQVAQSPRAVPVRVVNEPARAANPVVMKPASAPTYRPTAPAAAQAAPAAKAPETIPAAPSKPLPVTLHGLAAGRGKPVQVFTSPVAGELDLQVPRSNALPLRPVMTLGAAPVAAKETIKDPPKELVKEAKDDRKIVERATMVKPDPRRRPDPHFSNGKVRKPEAEPQREKIEQPRVAVATAVREPEPLPAKKPEDFPAPRPFPTPDLDLPSLALDSGGGFWGKLPAAGKAGIGVGGILALAGVIFAISHGGTAKPVNAAPQIVEGPALTAVESGWITDWGAEPGVRREHEISVLRPSLNLTDYRLQFEAQIDTKALGWIYRAQDGKNYYVNKLEIVKPGLNPTIALVRFAVIDGQEQPRAQFPLTLPVHLDTLYKVRFDAVGDRFTTYVQDQKVDEWTDDRLKMGGIGLYNERGERMSLKGTVNVVPLVIKK
ncbi:MAG TPA: hypothetical protein VKX39_04225 [Bryobacteraceae bacterium]|nr:hypothetical protein [Bryobacteraceae bacterium]